MSKGNLRADQVARTLVPALLEKADKVSRGKAQRTAGRNLNLAGVQELGFLLGQSYLLAKRYIDVYCFHLFSVFCFLLKSFESASLLLCLCTSMTIYVL